MADVHLPEPAPEIIMAANGIYWRRYADEGMLSMVPTSDDNDPVIGPLAVYKLVGHEDHDGHLVPSEIGDSGIAVAEIRRALVAELKDTIPVGIDVMRALRFDQAAMRAFEIAVARLTPALPKDHSQGESGA